MALWPFGRRKRKAAQRDDQEEQDDDIGISTRITAGQDGKSKAARPRSDSRQSSKQSVRKLSKTRDVEKSAPLPPPVPALPRDMTPSPAAQFASEKRIEIVQPAKTRNPLSELQNPEEAPPKPFFKNEQNTASQSSLQPENFTANPLSHTPTLRAKRSSTAADVAPRRKSSKRRTTEKSREQEIRAMSSPIPIPRRPRSYTSGMLAKDSKKIPGGLNRSLARPMSEVSLPLAESLRSSISGPHELQNSYKVSAFDALSPRPTIRYSESPLRASGGGGIYGAARSSARKDKGPSIPEESDFSPRARIDDLADELDASGLRQLMERDRRRRERKKKSDQEKLNRRLQRRAEKQRMEGLPPGETVAPEAAAAADHTQEESKEAAELAGLGIVSQEVVDTSSRDVSGEQSRQEMTSRAGTRSPGSWLEDPSRENLHSISRDEGGGEDPMNSSRLDLTATDDEREEPVILETAKAVRLSAASLSPPASPVQKHARGPSNLSIVTNQTPELQRNVAPPPPLPLLEPERSQERLQKVDSSSNRGSDAGLKPVVSGWTSFFRRSGTKQQQQRDSNDQGGRLTPSEFSNTSRESFVARQSAPPMPVVQRSFKPPPKSSEETTPKRTKSKFREELPEYPRTPPPLPSSSSRPISPTSPFIDHSSKVSTMDDEAKVSTPLENVHPVFRSEVAELSRNQSVRSALTPEPPSSALLSQSLASVDSEGSWLSGRPPKRSSIPISSMRKSDDTLGEQLRETPEEPYFARRAHSPGQRPQGPGGLTAGLNPAAAAATADEFDRASPTASRAATSPGEAEGPLSFHTVQGGKPTIVRGSPTTQRSREGLLDEYAASTTTSDPADASRRVSRFSATTASTADQQQAIMGGTGASTSPHHHSRSTGSSSPDTPTGGGTSNEEQTSLHRATSIDYGAGHSRRVSAGSARLLEILPSGGIVRDREKRASNLSVELASTGGVGGMAVEEGEKLQGAGEAAGRSRIESGEIGPLSSLSSSVSPNNNGNDKKGGSPQQQGDKKGPGPASRMKKLGLL